VHCATSAATRTLRGVCIGLARRTFAALCFRPPTMSPTPKVFLAGRCPAVAEQLVCVLRSLREGTSAKEAYRDPWNECASPAAQDAWIKAHADPNILAGPDGAETVVARSGHYAVWECPEVDRCGGHRWLAQISGRVNKDGKMNRGCPGCVGQCVTTQNCLSKVCPMVAAQLVQVLRSVPRSTSVKEAYTDSWKECAVGAQQDAWIKKHADPDIPAGLAGGEKVAAGSHQYGAVVGTETTQSTQSIPQRC
jgi:hypothetical protein